MSKEKMYPENLLSDIHFNERFHADLDYKNLTDDQLEGLKYFSKRLTPRGREIILQHYRDGMSLKAVAAEYQVEERRVRNILRESLRKYKGLAWSRYVSEGYNARMKRLQQRLKEEKEIFFKKKGIRDSSHLYYASIENLDLSVRTRAALKRNEIVSVEELIPRIPYRNWYRDIRSIGEGQAGEIIKVLQRGKLLPENYNEIIWEPMPGLDEELFAFQSLNLQEKQILSGNMDGLSVRIFL